MVKDVTRNSVSVKTRKSVLRKERDSANLELMKQEGWFNRLVEAIEADGRDLKTLSLAAKCGQNYVQQLVKYRRQPTVGRFVRILEALGRAQSLYIILGVDMSPEDEELFQMAAGLSPGQKRAAIDFFRSQQAPQQTPSPPAGRK